MYYAGYWEGSKGRVEHDHKFDKEKDRDFRHDRWDTPGNSPHTERV